MAAYPNFEKRSKSTWPARVLLLPDAVAAALDRAEPQTDNSAVYAAWDLDRQRQRLSTRPSWPLPPLMGGLRLFMLHPTLAPSEAFSNQHPLAIALKRRGYSLVFPTGIGQGKSGVLQCQLLVLVISTESARDLTDRRNRPWAEVFAACADRGLAVLSVWISGDKLPLIFSPDAFLDLRREADPDAAVGHVFPERQVRVLGIRADRTVRSIGSFPAGELAKVRRAVEELDDTGQFDSIRLVTGPNEIPADEAAEIWSKIQGVESLLDPKQRRLRARGDPELWPGLGSNLTRAADLNARKGIKPWNLKRLAARRAEKEGGPRELLIDGLPRLFISYRWEETEHESWVDRLAGELFSRGYDVVFDRHPEVTVNPQGADDLFFEIAASTVFLAVVTEGYLAGIQTRADSWSVREWQEAVRLRQMDDEDGLRIVLLWRSGKALPRAFVSETVLDLRNEEAWGQALEKEFPPVRVILKVTSSQGSVELGPLPRAEIESTLATLGPGTRIEARVADERSSEERQDLVGDELSRLFDAKKYEEAFVAAVKAIDKYPRWWLPRLVIGSIFDDLNAYWYARNHLLFGETDPQGAGLAVTNDLGVVYMHLGALDRAEACFRKVLERDPTHKDAQQNLSDLKRLPPSEASSAMEIDGPVLSCSNCASIFNEESPTCYGCGFPREADKPCPYCHTTRLARRDDAKGCPICRQGQLTMRDSVLL